MQPSSIKNNIIYEGPEHMILKKGVLMKRNKKILLFLFLVKFILSKNLLFYEKKLNLYFHTRSVISKRTTHIWWYVPVRQVIGTQTVRYYYNAIILYYSTVKKNKKIIRYIRVYRSVHPNIPSDILVPYHIESGSKHQNDTVKRTLLSYIHKHVDYGKYNLARLEWGDVLLVSCQKSIQNVDLVLPTKMSLKAWQSSWSACFSSQILNL